MAKKILVLQFRTDQSLKHERECIIKTGGFKKTDLLFLNVLNLRTKLPGVKNLTKYKGIILGGSGQVDISGWLIKDIAKIKRIKVLVRRAIRKDIPMLNICFGHQLIAKLLGGEVKLAPKQSETGTYKIYLNQAAKNCPLFKNIPNSFYAVLGHKDSVTKLPKGACLLAYSDKCGIEAYKIKNNIYSVQFHPEIDKEGVKTRLNLYPSYTKSGSIEKILKEYRETPFAKMVISNFKHICDTATN